MPPDLQPKNRPAGRCAFRMSRALRDAFCHSTGRDAFCYSTGRASFCYSTGRASFCYSTGRASFCHSTGRASFCHSTGRASFCHSTGRASFCYSTGRASFCYSTGRASFCHSTGRASFTSTSSPFVAATKRLLRDARNASERAVGSTLVLQRKAAPTLLHANRQPALRSYFAHCHTDPKIYFRCSVHGPTRQAGARGSTGAPSFASLPDSVRLEKSSSWQI